MKIATSRSTKRGRRQDSFNSSDIATSRTMSIHMKLLEAEYSALQDALIKALKSRLKRSSGAVAGNIDSLLSEMSQAAIDTVAPINATLTSSPGQVERIEVATPENWEQVVWSFAMRMQSEGGKPLDVALHGSGNSPS